MFLNLKSNFLLLLNASQNAESLAVSGKACPKKPNVGGQAVIEGVMMRGPEAWAIALRRADGTTEVKCEKYLPWSLRYPILGKPFLRGAVVLLESMVLGIKALNFSAEMAAKDEEVSVAKSSCVENKNSEANNSCVENKNSEANNSCVENKNSEANNSCVENKNSEIKEAPALGFWPIALALVSAFGLAMLLFVALPHILAAFMGSFAGFDDTAPLFHLIDGLIKFTFFLLYVGLIGFIPDIKRVYAYHGAEHQAIYTYENDEELLVANARKHKAWHPRCGTAFIFLVLAISIIFFAAVFPYIFSNEGGGIFRMILGILVKIAFMFPLAGLAYEVTRLAGKAKENSFWRYLLWPGLVMQRLTTRKPNDGQLEIAIVSLKKALNLN